MDQAFDPDLCCWVEKESLSCYVLDAKAEGGGRCAGISGCRHFSTIRRCGAKGKINNVR